MSDKGLANFSVQNIVLGTVENFKMYSDGYSKQESSDSEAFSGWLPLVELCICMYLRSLVWPALNHKYSFTHSYSDFSAPHFEVHFATKLHGFFLSVYSVP